MDSQKDINILYIYVKGKSQKILSSFCTLI